MNIKATDFCDVSNSAGGVIKAINELQSGDTLIFPKNEYHFYKEYCVHKVCHMTNTDSTQKYEVPQQLLYISYFP